MKSFDESWRLSQVLKLVLHFINLSNIFVHKTLNILGQTFCTILAPKCCGIYPSRKLACQKHQKKCFVWRNLQFFFFITGFAHFPNQINLMIFGVNFFLRYHNFRRISRILRNAEPASYQWLNKEETFFVGKTEVPCENKIRKWKLKVYHHRNSVVTQRLNHQEERVYA